MNPTLNHDLIKFARLKNIEGLKSSLDQLSRVESGQAMFAIGNIIGPVMKEGWSQGLDEILKTKTAISPHTMIPESQVREGLMSLMSRVSPIDKKLEDTLGVLAKYSNRLSPSLKADIAFEVAPFISQSLYDACRRVKLMDASNTNRINFRLHGASATNTAFPGRVAELIAEMPSQTKAQIYNAYLTGDKSVKTFSRSFLTGVLQDKEFFESKDVNSKKFKIDKDFIAEPDFAAVLIQKNMLTPDQAFTAYWRNPESTVVANAFAGSLSAMLKASPQNIDAQKTGAWLKMASENFSTSSDPQTRQNAVRVTNQLKENLGLPVADPQFTPKVA